MEIIVKNKTLYTQVKGIIKRIPIANIVYRYLFNIKNIIILNNEKNNEIASLIKDKKTAVLNPYFKMDKNELITYEIVHDVVKDFFDVYKTIRFRKKTTKVIDLPKGAILLHLPLALLKIPSTHEEYLKRVGDKTRNMIRKADKQGYGFKEFVWNDHLDEIFEINTSKEVRQSAMRGWYRELVKPRYYTIEEQQYRKYYGAFKDGKLYAYLHLVLCGDFAFFRHFIGHAQHLRYGIMNGLISWTVKEYIENSQIRWLKYGTLRKKPHPLESFRKHAGFEGYATFIDIEDDHELFKFSKNVRLRPWWYV